MTFDKELRQDLYFSSIKLPDGQMFYVCFEDELQPYRLCVDRIDTFLVFTTVLDNL